MAILIILGVTAFVLALAGILVTAGYDADHEPTPNWGHRLIQSAEAAVLIMFIYGFYLLIYLILKGG